MSKSVERLILALMLAGYLALALAYLMVSPPLEGADEIEHFVRLQKAAAGDHLPNPNDTSLPGQYPQPPLYYALLAPLLGVWGTADFLTIYEQQNPYYNGLTTPVFQNDNRNRLLHLASQEFPLLASPTTRSVYLVRLTSVVFGLVCLIASYGILRRLFTRKYLALGALAVVAFNPQFLYHTSHITNDSASYAWGAVTIGWLLSFVEHPPQRRTGILLGVLLGTALLVKISLVALLFGVAAAFMLYPAQRKSLVLAGAIGLTLVSWWLIHNTIHYGDPTLNSFSATIWFVQSLEPPTLPYILERLWILHQRTWGVFGMATVFVPDWIYRLFAFLIAAGVVGSLVALRQAEGARRRAVLVSGAVGAGILLSTFYLTLTIWQGNQGRYLLVAGFAIGAMMVGAAYLLPRRAQPLFAGILGFGMPLIAIIALITALFPAYHVSIGANEQPALFRYGDVAELLAVQPAEIHAQPGGIVRLTLTWRSLQPGGDLRVFIHSEGGQLKQDSYPGTGRHLALDWQSGEVWDETHVFQLPTDLLPQTVYPLLIGLYDTPSEAALPAFDTVGTSVTPLAARLVVQGEAQPTPSLEASFGNAIGLVSVSIERNEDNQPFVCMEWAALSDGQTDLRRFVHAFDDVGEFLGQSDDDPHVGTYPARYWLKGEIVQDCILLPFETTASVAIGWYNPATNERIPATDADGAPLADNLFRQPVV